MQLHHTIHRSTLLISLLAIIGLCFAIVMVRTRTPATHASGSEIISAPVPQTDASWEEVAAQARSAYAQGNVDYSRVLLVSYQASLMAEKVDAAHTGEVLSQVLALTALVAKIDAHVTVDEFNQALAIVK